MHKGYCLYWSSWLELIVDSSTEDFCQPIYFVEDSHIQWRTDGGLGVHSPPRNSKDVAGVLHRMSKKNRRLDFLL